jgi:transposase
MPKASPSINQTAVIGCDTGIKTIAQFSSGVKTPDKDIHGHDLTSILHKIKRKKKGSKAFHRALDHKDNFIRWSINQLNLSNVKEIRLEFVSNFRHKKNVGEFLNHSGEALIRSKLIDFAEENGVHIVLQNSAYRSRRCSCCGYVDEDNRKEKLFSCKNCLFKSDADLNASLNHEQDLPCANFLRFLPGRNEKFLWYSKGFFNLEGQEIAVPGTYKRYKNI